MALKFEDLDARLTGDDANDPSGKSNWFRRIKKGIVTSTAEKKETPEGLWNKCPECGHIMTVSDLEEQQFVCPKCDHHHRISSQEYFELLFDDGKFTEIAANIRSFWSVTSHRPSALTLSIFTVNLFLISRREYSCSIPNQGSS